MCTGLRGVAAARGAEPGAAPVPAGLAATREEARDELRRADSKVTTLLSLVGAALAGVVALTQRGGLGPAALVALWLAAVPIAASVALLLATLRPRLARVRPVPGSWVHAAQATGAELLAAYDDGAAAQRGEAEDVCRVARLARAKYRRLAQAVTLLAAGLVVLATALVLNALT